MIAAGAGRAGPRDRRSVGLTEQVGQELGQEAVTVPSYSAASAIGRDLSRTSRPAACGRRVAAVTAFFMSSVNLFTTRRLGHSLFL